MPVVLRVQGFQARIFLPGREHGPAHVHVTNADGEVVILLNTSEQRVTIRRTHGMKARDVERAIDIVETNANYLREQWRRYHGE